MRKSQSGEKMVGVREKAIANWMQKTMETEQEKGKLAKVSVFLSLVTAQLRRGTFSCFSV